MIEAPRSELSYQSADSTQALEETAMPGGDVDRGWSLLTYTVAAIKRYRSEYQFFKLH